MRFKIFKYKIVPDRETGIAEVDIETGAEILSIQEQNGIICLWAKVIHHGLTTKRTFLVAVTGHEEYDDEDNLKYLDTVLMLDGQYVFHVFEALPKK